MTSCRRCLQEVVSPQRQLRPLDPRTQVLAGQIGNRWTQERVTALRTYHEIPCYRPEQRHAEGWMNLTEAAKLLGLASRTLRVAVERGEIEAQHPLRDGPWVFKRSALERPRRPDSSSV